MTYFKVWKIWSASNNNNFIYKLAVFLGFIKSPTFDIFKNVYNVR